MEAGYGMGEDSETRERCVAVDPGGRNPVKHRLSGQMTVRRSPYGARRTAHGEWTHLGAFGRSWPPQKVFLTKQTAVW